jgi:hypothetical protein
MVERDAPVVDVRNVRGVPSPVPPRIFVPLENARAYADESLKSAE